MPSEFVTPNFISLINFNVVEKMLPNIPPYQKDLILKCIVGLIKIIAVCFGFYQNSEQFYVKLKQNDYEDIKWLTFLLLPYISEQQAPLASITDLNDVYTAKVAPVDINRDQPAYKFSNLQYGRCRRHSDEYEEIKYSDDHIIHNYYLLIDTIRRCSYKLHVNWRDILPYRLDDYSLSQIFLDTVDKVTNHQLSDFDCVAEYPFEEVYETPSNVLASKLKGLGIDDIYNTISINLYENIVNIKWFLYYVGITADTNKLVIPLIIYLNLVFGGQLMSECLIKDIVWEALPTSVQEDFKLRWKLLITGLDEDINIDMRKNKITVDKTYSKSSLYAILLFFERKSGQLPDSQNDTIMSYITLEQNKDDPKKMSPIDSIRTSAKSLRPNYVYDFLRKSIRRFKYTWFSLNLMNKEKSQFVDYSDTLFMVYKDTQITYKNVYNFCKAVVIYPDGSKKFARFPKQWDSADDAAKTEIANRLNAQYDPAAWFNIPKNIQKLYDFIDEPIDVTAANKNIHEAIMGSLVNIIFETMIITGTMTKLVPNNDYTNKMKYDPINNSDDKKELVARLSRDIFYGNSPYETNSYYYLTGKPYGMTQKYAVDAENKNKLVGYFDVVKNPDFSWYLTTAYSWIAQLGFCHKFLNNRVTYITGGTGAGKSTQVPKLYCYFLIALENKLDPTILVTLPRINALLLNSSRVSRELALPFEGYVNNELEMTENYQIQYKYMGGKWIHNDNHPKIRFVTDGSILQDIKNPLFKRKLVDNIFTQNNSADVVIVDEAHEHNTNMDMIMTMMRNCLYFNNQVRFVIMSATLDNDEFVYRRYYRIINDNQKYPVNLWIEKHKLDRINVDRRFDIQPPIKSKTSLLVTEYYVPNRQPETVIKEIFAGSRRGDVLLFQPGVSDITKCVQILNSAGFLPPDVLAVPYYSAMKNEDYPTNADWVERLDEKIKDIRISKEEVFETSELTKGNSHYVNFVLVATNIAEASITIKTLKYVVDTGTEKVMEFDVAKKRNILTKHWITEQSRMQRRGRVGRVGTGTVYYLYRMGEFKQNKKLYNIALSNIQITVLFNFLRNHDDVPLFTDELLDMVSGNYTASSYKVDLVRSILKTFVTDDNVDAAANIIVDNKDKLQYLKDTKIVKSFFADVLSETNSEVAAKNVKFIYAMMDYVDNQYTRNGTVYAYKGLQQMYDYENETKYPFTMYASGVDITSLFDETGKFYVIHPEELYIERNLGGDIVSINSKKLEATLIENSSYKKKIMSTKLLIFFDSLIRRLFITVDDNSPTRPMMKTCIGRFVLNIIEEFTSDRISEPVLNFMANCIMLIDPEHNPRDSEHLENLLNIMALLVVTKMDILRLCPKAINQFTTLVLFAKMTAAFQKDGDDDIDLLINVANFINKTTSNKTSDYMKSKYLQNDTFGNINIKNIGTGISNEFMLTEDGIEERTRTIKKIIESHIKDLAKNATRHKYLFENIGLAQQTEKFLKWRENLRLYYNDLIAGVNRHTQIDYIDATTVRTKMKCYREYMDKLNIDPVRGAMLLSMPENIYVQLLERKNFYAPVFNPTIDAISELGPTSLKPIYLARYILSLQAESNKLSFVVKLDQRHLELVANLFKMSQYKNKHLINVVEPENMSIVVSYDATLNGVAHDAKIALSKSSSVELIKKVNPMCKMY